MRGHGRQARAVQRRGLGGRGSQTLLRVGQHRQTLRQIQRGYPVAHDLFGQKRQPFGFVAVIITALTPNASAEL